MKFVCAGRCFRLAERTHDKRHLWIVLTDPHGTPPMVAAVMVRTATRFTDSTVVLKPGDHDFINRDSAVSYSGTQILSVDKLLKWASHPDCGIETDLRPDVLARVRQGLLDSHYSVPRIRDYCRDRF